MNMTMYEINEEIYRIMSEDNDVEVEGSTTYDSMAMLDDLLMAREVKLDNVGMYVKELSAMAQAIKDEEQSLVKRRKTLESKAEYLKKYLSQSLQSQGDTKFISPRLVLTFRKSESVNVIDENLISDCYKRVVETKTVDKAVIKQAIKEGEIVPGAELVTSYNLQIK